MTTKDSQIEKQINTIFESAHNHCSPEILSREHADLLLKDFDKYKEEDVDWLGHLLTPPKHPQEGRSDSSSGYGISSEETVDADADADADADMGMRASLTCVLLYMHS